MLPLSDTISVSSLTTPEISLRTDNRSVGRVHIKTISDDCAKSVFVLQMTYLSGASAILDMVLFDTQKNCRKTFYSSFNMDIF